MCFVVSAIIPFIDICRALPVMCTACSVWRIPLNLHHRVPCHKVHLLSLATVFGIRPRGHSILRDMIWHVLLACWASFGGFSQFQWGRVHVLFVALGLELGEPDPLLPLHCGRGQHALSKTMRARMTPMRVARRTLLAPPPAPCAGSSGTGTCSVPGCGHCRRG